MAFGHHACDEITDVLWRRWHPWSITNPHLLLPKGPRPPPPPPPERTKAVTQYYVYLFNKCVGDSGGQKKNLILPPPCGGGFWGWHVAGGDGCLLIYLLYLSCVLPVLHVYVVWGGINRGYWLQVGIADTLWKRRHTGRSLIPTKSIQNLSPGRMRHAKSKLQPTRLGIPHPEAESKENILRIVCSNGNSCYCPNFVWQLLSVKARDAWFEGSRRLKKSWEACSFYPAIISCQNSFMVPNYDQTNKTHHECWIQEYWKLSVRLHWSSRYNSAPCRHFDTISGQDCSYKSPGAL